jgi:hypothetical protein
VPHYTRSKDCFRLGVAAAGGDWVLTSGALLLDWRPKGSGQMTNSCRKLEIRLSLPHEQSWVSAWPRPQLPFRWVLPRGAGRKKYLSRHKSRNPLKSLDSDERIQGNPSESKAQKRGLRSEGDASQENPNG